jgi:hypothetical protein
VVGEVSAVDADDPVALRCAPVYRRDPASGVAVACGQVPRRCVDRMARNGVRFPVSLFAEGAGE